MTVALVDTSVWVALEKDRLINRDLMPEVSRVSVVTLAELHAGVLAAPNAIIQTERLRTLERAQAI
ncbi:MAG TPA: VapC toxin family PIN domain ribonuclease, partial [Phycicoccus sp.]|nr:VapC toxin family PIN domain ribonuclease [Phycicoccus sp.]